MRVAVVLETRYYRTPDGCVWTERAAGHVDWSAYLRVFDAVTIVARTRVAATHDSNWQRVDGPDIRLHPVPDYHGPWQYLWNLPRVADALGNSFGKTDAVILRVGSVLASHVERKLRSEGHPYAVEVVADPHDVFSRGAVKTILRPFLHWWFPRELRRQCNSACAAAYVTAHALQRRYPSNGYTVGVSDVELPDEAYAAEPKRAVVLGGREMRLISVGGISQLYKAPDVVLRAIQQCDRMGLNLTLEWVGDGQYRPKLEKLAEKLGIGSRVVFAGRVPREQVRDHFDRADVFVLASRQEGLPRALLEAMARGLPCIGTSVGGIPELLEPEYLVRAGDVNQLAAKFAEVIRSPERTLRASARNLDVARRYHKQLLLKQRVDFFRYVRMATESWLCRTAGHLSKLPAVCERSGASELL